MINGLHMATEKTSWEYEKLTKELQINTEHLTVEPCSFLYVKLLNSHFRISILSYIIARASYVFRVLQALKA